MKNIVIYIVLIVIAVGAVFYFAGNSHVSYQDLQGTPSLSASPIVTSSPTPGSVKPSPKPTSDLVPAGNTMLGNLPPVVCKLTGEVEFDSQQSYINRNNFLEYKNVDHTARLVTWSVSPAVPEGTFSIGPNIFARIPIPDGKEMISVTINKPVTEKLYTLTARVNYGKWVNGVLELGESKCDGQVLVKINY